MSEKGREAVKAASSVSLSPGPDVFMARWGVFLASGIIVLAALVAYHDSFSGPFILDDSLAIPENPTLRRLQLALSPLHNGSGVDGRPLVNLSLAMNYAAGGTQVWGYHAVNLAIHILAGLTLFGILRRTLLELPTFNLQYSTSKTNHLLDGASNLGAISQESRFADATMLALAVALLWTVHPLVTEAVTYVIQRNESLMGLFYLLTLYCFIRGAESRRQETGIGHQEKEFKNQNPQATLPLSSVLTPDASSLWYAASILCCLLGMASKEVMASAPLIVLLYDRTFVAGTFQAAWRQHWRLYLGLGSTWLLLAHLMMGTHNRGGACGFGFGVSWWEYALTQCRAIMHYLRLSIWPHPLVFDYGSAVVKRPGAVMPQALILILLVAGIVAGLWRGTKVSFVGICFFAILSPSSSVVPNITQTMAEHRMYLPLAGVITLGVLGLYGLVGRRSLILFAAVAVGLALLTIQRNKDYRSELAIWSDTVAKCPDNERAHVGLGAAFSHVPGRLSDEIAEYQAALRIKPDYAEAHNNLGNALLQVPGRLPDAMAEYKTALRIKPGYAEAHINLGNALLRMPGHVPEVLAEYKSALRINPRLADAYYDAGCVLSQIPGRLPDAIAAYQAALRINPDQSEAHYNLGCALLQIHARWPEAIAEFEAALQINPDYADAHVNLGYALLQVPGHGPEAMSHFETALQIRPDFKEVRQELDRLRAHP